MRRIGAEVSTLLPDMTTLLVAVYVAGLRMWVEVDPNQKMTSSQVAMCLLVGGLVLSICWFSYWAFRHKVYIRRTELGRGPILGGITGPRGKLRAGFETRSCNEGSILILSCFALSIDPAGFYVAGESYFVRCVLAAFWTVCPWSFLL